MNNLTNEMQRNIDLMADHYPLSEEYAILKTNINELVGIYDVLDQIDKDTQEGGTNLLFIDGI